MAKAPKHILFLCVANSARSQMAEGLARRLFAKEVKISSAGSNPGVLNPLAVEALAEIGIDISSQFSKPVSEVDANSVDLVITLCAEEVCPVLPASIKVMHWRLSDPAATEGTKEEKLASFRNIREQIQKRLDALAHDGLTQEVTK